MRRAARGADLCDDLVARTERARSFGGLVRTGVLLAIGSVVTVTAYGVLASRWVSSDPGWYDALKKPAWQPPDWVFGVAWPYNFLALAVSGVVLALTATTQSAGTWLAVLVVNAGLALGWAYLFYVPHALWPAAAVLSASAVLAWVLVVLAWQAVPWTGAVLVPYAVWLSVATSLAAGFAVTA
jgi:tryptophan-rich sensory protein